MHTGQDSKYYLLEKCCTDASLVHTRSVLCGVLGKMCEPAWKHHFGSESGF